MNVLFFVMTMLMLLALMTYGRMESFLGFAFVEAQFKDYMEHTERNYVNQEAWINYDKETGSNKENGKPNERNPATPKLSFNLFVDKDERDKHAQDLEIQIYIAKNLMHFLYGDQPFFIDIEQKRPDFLNEIFSALIRVTDEYTKKEKLNSNKVEELATIDLGDIELNEVFTKMLKGSIEKAEETDSSEKIEAPPHPFKPERGYYSLLDFITIQKNKLRIRIYLASPQVLMAIFGNVDLVNQIIEIRNRIFNTLIHANEDSLPGVVKSSEEEFQNMFQNHQLSSIPGEILDFGVSKTNPRKYN